MESREDITSVSFNLGQVSGSPAPVNHTGIWPVILGNRFVPLPEVLSMPKNPTCTIGGHALKSSSGYKLATHEINEYFFVQHQDGLSFKFTRTSGTLRVINGFDYIPLFYWVEKLHTDINLIPSKPPPHPIACAVRH